MHNALLGGRSTPRFYPKINDFLPTRQEETRFKTNSKNHYFFDNIKNKKGVIKNEYYSLLWSKQRKQKEYEK
jgi:hypothetical protein